MLLRQERHRRAGHHVEDGGQAVRCRLRDGDEPVIVSGVAGSMSMPPVKSLTSASRYRKPGDDPEVAAAAADGPEQVRMVVRVHLEHLAVGGHELDGQQVVDGQAVLPGQVADAATQGDAADAHRPGVAEPGREPVLDGRGRDSPAVTPAPAQTVRPRHRSRGPSCRRTSMTMPPSTAREAAGAVAAAADRERHPAVAREVHAAAHRRRSPPRRWPRDGGRRVGTRQFAAAS